ncbi:MAG: Crp/Fnr family transcriptional regulator [Chitinophagaceae bacterium]|nr:Crp/Fnr family transcriptional regulator [Chitinophagaceae bacterium]
MNREILQKYITSILPMPTDKSAFFAEQFEPIKFSKDELLLKENKINKDTFVLESGYIRSFTFNQNDEEVTTNIFSAPCFVNDFLSFFKQQPTSENYQCLTHCKLWTMSYEKVQTCFHTYPEFREFGRMMLVTNYSNLHDRMLGMVKDTAENRYLKLMKNHPDIFQNVPLKFIASYLGITDTSLSRIRKEIASK